jgi:hypothetical protein
MATLESLTKDILTGSDSASILAGKLNTSTFTRDSIEKSLMEGGTMYTTEMGTLVNILKQNAAQPGAESALKAIEAQLGARTNDTATAQKIHEDTYRRQFEINEWTAANRQETLFVYQFIFFTIIILTLIASLYRINVVGGYFTSFASFLIILAMVFIIVYRAQYTAFKRDKRYWNKRRFDSAGAVFATPNCPAVTDFVTSLPGNIEGALEKSGGALKGTLGSGLESLGNTLSGAGAAIKSQ